MRWLKIWWLKVRYEGLSTDIVNATERVRFYRDRAEEMMIASGKLAERVRVMQAQRSAIGGTIASLKTPEQIIKEATQ